MEREEKRKDHWLRRKRDGILAYTTGWKNVSVKVTASSSLGSRRRDESVRF